MRRIRKDKKLWVLKTNECCRFQELILDDNYAGIRSHWRGYLNNSGDYYITRMTVEDLEAYDCTFQPHLRESIQAQLKILGR